MLDKDIFKDHSDYWLVAENIRDIYLSEGSLLTLLDYERVLDELDLYAFRNWQLGELVQGPDIGRYKVGCIFMWPEKLMPDPRGARRLLPFDCEIRYKRTNIKIASPGGRCGEGDPGSEGPQCGDRKGVRRPAHHQGRRDRRQGNRTVRQVREYGRADGARSRLQDQ